MIILKYSKSFPVHSLCHCIVKRSVPYGISFLFYEHFCCPIFGFIAYFFTSNNNILTIIIDWFVYASLNRIKSESKTLLFFLLTLLLQFRKRLTGLTLFQYFSRRRNNRRKLKSWTKFYSFWRISPTMASKLNTQSLMNQNWLQYKKNSLSLFFSLSFTLLKTNFHFSLQYSNPNRVIYAVPAHLWSNGSVFKTVSYF